MKKRFSEEQIIGFLREADAGVPVKDLCRASRVFRGELLRLALKVVGISASSLRYQPAPDSNAELHNEIVTLAHRYRRYGAAMIALKLRQRGLVVNHKRVEHLGV